MNYLYLFKTKSKLKSHETAYENDDICDVLMLFEDTKILEFNQNWKSNKTPFLIYVDFESLIKKIDGFKNNSKKSSTTKVG